MKGYHLFLVSLILVALIFPVSVISAQELCSSPNILINLELECVESINKLSEYKYPDCVERDYLQIKTLGIYNHHNCTIPSFYLELDIIPKTGFSSIENRYIYPINIPPLNYTLYTLKLNYTHGGYQDNFGNTLNLRRIFQLDSTGVWQVYYNIKNSGYGSDLFVNNGYNKLFTVYTRKELESIKIALVSADLSLRGIKLTFWMAITSIILSGLLAFSIYFFERNDKRKEDKRLQIDLLYSIKTTLQVILSDSLGHKKEFNKRNNIPSYFITQLDSKEYISRLSSYIDCIDMSNIKNKMTKISHKIDTINNLIKIAQTSDIFDKKKKTKSIIKEIKKDDYTYHKDLEKLIHETLAEINTIIYRQK